VTARLKKIHNSVVTSNLAPNPKLARSCQRRTGCREPDRPTPKSNILKILTSKLFDIKILPTVFANPAPSETFTRAGGGGYPSNR
jgi:hypothetical protein